MRPVPRRATPPLGLCGDVRVQGPKPLCIGDQTVKPPVLNTIATNDLPQTERQPDNEQTRHHRPIPKNILDAFWHTASTIDVPVAGLVLDGDRLAVEPHVNDSPMLFDHLWCAHAPAHWDGVVAMSTGTVRESEHAVPNRGSEVSVQVMADRFGTVRSSISGANFAYPSSDCSLEPEGALVDALMRFMGCPTAEEPRDITHLVLTIWCDRLMSAILAARDQRLDFRAAFRAHPLVDGGQTPSSKDACAQRLADLTKRLAAETNWERLRLLCADGVSQFGGVSATEAAWADASMFARLLLERYPSLFDMLDLLDCVAPEPLARWVRQTVGVCLG